jgi:hypothetical protein
MIFRLEEEDFLSIEDLTRTHTMDPTRWDIYGIKCFGYDKGITEHIHSSTSNVVA